MADADHIVAVGHAAEVPSIRRPSVSLGRRKPHTHAICRALHSASRLWVIFLNSWLLINISYRSILNENASIPCL